MKKLILTALFILIPVLAGNAQDKTKMTCRDDGVIKYCTKEINCPECQGWGWLISVTYKLGNADSRLGHDFSLSRSRRNGNINTVLNKVKCYHCGGTGKIWVKAD
ncbi:MAG: hypothetical protein JW917_00725 [Ignavibacteria bacterium]|nr:hypothetical protein [Ignavibacteria bacterium]